MLLHMVEIRRNISSIRITNIMIMIIIISLLLFIYIYLLLFPTCQVRVVRFYVSCLLLLLLLLLLLSSSSSSSCSIATRDPQCSLSDLNHDHPRPVFPAGPQPRPSTPSVPCRTSTTTIHAQCSLPDLNWAWMVVVEVRQGTLGVDGRG